MIITRFFFIVFLSLFFFGESMAQGRVVTTATLALNSINHATCYGNNSTANIQLSVTSTSSPFVIGGYTLVINKDGVYYTTLSSSVLQSSASIAIPVTLPAGSYVISGTANVVNPSSSTFYRAPSFSNLSFFVAYQAVWTEVKEMAIQTLTSTVLQNVTTPT